MAEMKDVFAKAESKMNKSIDHLMEEYDTIRAGRANTAVLDNIMESYISGFIYSALIDSFCSEQNARMTAMDAANRNAEKLLGELSLQYNRVRQAAITQEITEVSAGAKAQRRKHRKEA